MVCTLTLLLIFIAEYQNRSLPKVWTKNLELTYHSSHSKSMDYKKYKFSYDTLHSYVNYSDDQNYHNAERKIKIEAMELNKILQVLKHNQADKIKIQTTNTAIYDGPSFTLRLQENEKHFINLSNSANEKLDDKDQIRFNEIIKRLKHIIAEIEASDKIKNKPYSIISKD